MHSHEVFKALLKKTSAKQVAGELNLSLSLVYKWAEPPGEGSGTPNPLDRIEAVVRVTGDRAPVQWLCERAGGFFIQNPDSRPHPYQLVPAMNEVVQEFADLLGAMSAAAADHEITPEEARAIRQRWEQLKSVAEGFVRSAEEGRFPSVTAPARAAK
jgi:hypothetical protein